MGLIYLLSATAYHNAKVWALGNTPQIHYLRVAFKIPFGCDCITHSCSHIAEVVQNHVSENYRNTGPVATVHRKYMGLKLGDEACDSKRD